MSDLDRYLTDEVVEKAARAEWGHEWPDRSWERTPDDFRDFYMSVARVSLSAVLPDIIRQAKAESLREAADQLDAYSPRDNPAPGDPRWTCDLGYYGEAAWLRARADRIEQGGQP